MRGAEDVGAQLVTLVEQEHGPASLLVRGGNEAFLRAVPASTARELSHEPDRREH